MAIRREALVHVLPTPPSIHLTTPNPTEEYTQQLVALLVPVVLVLALVALVAYGGAYHGTLGFGEEFSAEMKDRGYRVDPYEKPRKKTKIKKETW
ncbi:hypothetical protein AC579_1657 [Pseudocercospora musae]|uniref:Uncharacterized protein n=1 Tax=Pseudocercospora musae TaxID=113226 RepID=A0A139IAK8_9PEZI|nr:hypothetical protein AC579_1657 [Pseudocercospora musae]